MTREYGCGLFRVGREGAGELDANVRVETGPPHKDEIFSELVYPVSLDVFNSLLLVGSVEKEIKSIPES